MDMIMERGGERRPRRRHYSELAPRLIAAHCGERAIERTKFGGEIKIV